MADLHKKIERALTQKMKDHCMVHGFHYLKKNPGCSADAVRKHVGGALKQMADHVAGCGLCHRHTVNCSHKKAHKFLHGKGFFDSIKKFAQSIYSGVKKAYNTVKPFLGVATPLLKGALALHPTTAKFAPFVDTGLALADEHLSDPPTQIEQVEGSGFIADLAGSFGLGMKKGGRMCGAGSAAAKAKMARVRACKKQSGASLFPGGY